MCRRSQHPQFLKEGRRSHREKIRQKAKLFLWNRRHRDSDQERCEYPGAGQPGSLHGKISGYPRLPPSTQLNLYGRLDPKNAGESELRGEQLFFDKARFAVCHPAPYYTDNLMHDLMSEQDKQDLAVSMKAPSGRNRIARVRYTTMLLSQGPGILPGSAGRPQRMFAISRKTLVRWFACFRDEFPLSAKRQELRGRVVATGENSRLRGGLLECCLETPGSVERAPAGCLRFLARALAVTVGFEARRLSRVHRLNYHVS